MQSNDVEAQILALKDFYGVYSDKELATEIGVDPSTIAAWRRRGAVAKKHLLHMRAVEGLGVAESIGSSTEFDVHILALFIEICRNEGGRLNILLASDRLEHLFIARQYFILRSHLEKEMKKRRANSLEQKLAILDEFRIQFEGDNRLRDLIAYLNK